MHNATCLSNYYTIHRGLLDCTYVFFCTLGVQHAALDLSVEYAGVIGVPVTGSRPGNASGSSTPARSTWTKTFRLTTA